VSLKIGHLRFILRQNQYVGLCSYRLIHGGWIQDTKKAAGLIEIPMPIFTYII